MFKVTSKVIPHAPRAHVPLPPCAPTAPTAAPARTHTGALRRLVFAATAGVSLAAASVSAAPTAAYADAGPQARPSRPSRPSSLPWDAPPTTSPSPFAAPVGVGTGGSSWPVIPVAGVIPTSRKPVGRSTGAPGGEGSFRPVPPDSVCTMMYGGPATAHVTGTWAGRPVDATFDRSNGCQMARWDRLVPLLPDLR